MGAMAEPKILLVTVPAQGHINPSLQLAKRLIHYGVHVTFMTAASAFNRMNKTFTTTQGLSYATFSDYDQGFNRRTADLNLYMAELRRCGSQALRELIVESINTGTRFNCVVYSLMLPWVATVAREFHIPATFLWNQQATLFNIYYQSSKRYEEVIENGVKDPMFVMELPGLPPLSRYDLPSFYIPPNPLAFVLPTLKEHFEILDEETNPKVLVNTIDELEAEAMKAVDKYKLVGIGPLMPSNPNETSIGGDIFKVSKEKKEMEWLNSKPKSSVIYVSFGSLAVLSKAQIEEIAKGLLETGRPFLWVIREDGTEQKTGEEKGLSCEEELEKQGMIVPWCSQVEVLSHRSVGCFVTHCGWNSTFESLVCGVPMVTFPQVSDQPTNSKLVEDVWKTGVRLTKNEEGLVEGCEIKRCLELVMGGGERGEEIRKNAKKLKELTREGAKENGSSDKNLKAFLNELSINRQSC
ncbi:UDP-glucuronosyl/UDP-glucosyltransferase [Corchorus capsularis]|uniref:Glycosyltransferase n=1 Tax=Corchorus capsularis TaxID=210143 RepID=A0A1R3GCZ2_COCAP|nr:UDP-glucuronosyl/UDP-glucosyltransferase [Corchorus capsularis]